MKKIKKIFIRASIKLRAVVPNKFAIAMEDYFFLYAPIWLIRILTVSTDGYFKFHMPKKGDVVFDFGAYEGNFSIIASRLVGEKGIVYTFEPQKEMFDFINERIKKYGLKNIVSIDKGIYSHKTSLRIDNKTPNAGFSVVKQKDDLLSDADTIDLIDLDSFIDDYEIKRVDFIKMDIEGAEIEALQGAKKSLNLFSPRIAIASYHIRDGKRTAEWVENFLNEQGYTSCIAFPAHLTTYGYKS